MVDTQEGANGWECQRAMAVANNVVVDINACGYHIVDQGGQIADKIVAKVNKETVAAPATTGSVAQPDRSGPSARTSSTADMAVAQLGQPFLGVLTDQLDRPRERVRTGACDAGVDQRVEHLAFRLLQARHHRDRDVGEQDPLSRSDLDAPGNLAPVALLRFLGDGHPLRPGFFAESRDAAFGARGAFFCSGLGCRPVCRPP